MMLAKISRRMKELLRDDRGLQLYIADTIEDCLAPWPGGLWPKKQRVIERLPRRFQTRIAAPKQRPHVRGNQRIRQPVKCLRSLDVSYVKRAGNMKIDNTVFRRNRANARLPCSVFKRNHFHGDGPASRGFCGPPSLLPAMKLVEALVRVP